MNENNKTVLTPEEIDAILDAPAKVNHIVAGKRDRFRIFGRAIERAVIAKLGGMPADEWLTTLADIRKEALEGAENGWTVETKAEIERLCDHAASRILPAASDSKFAGTEELLIALGLAGVQVCGGTHGNPWQIRPPAASDAAPTIRNPLMVASEAGSVPVAWLYRGCRFPGRHLYEYRDVLSLTQLDHYYTGVDGEYVKGEPLYAAPPAESAHPADAGIPEPRWLQRHNALCDLLVADILKGRNWDITLLRESGYERVQPTAATANAHEIWSAAQLTPGDGIEDGVRRIEALLGGAATADAQGDTHEWLMNAKYGGESCALCGAIKGSRRGNAPCARQTEQDQHVQSRPGNQGAPQNEGANASTVGGQSRLEPGQHCEHGNRQADDHRAHDQRDSGSDGVSGACTVQAQEITEPDAQLSGNSGELNAQGDWRPRVPANVIAAIQAYGDARADGAATGAFKIGETVEALRDWAATIRNSLADAQGDEPIFYARQVGKCWEVMNHAFPDSLIKQGFFPVYTRSAPLTDAQGDERAIEWLRRRQDWSMVSVPSFVAREIMKAFDRAALSRQPSAAASVNTIDYGVLYEFSQNYHAPFNKLCTAVRAALAAVKPEGGSHE